MSDIQIHTYSIAISFSKYPGGRIRDHGPYSGEQFREDVLLPLLKDHDRLCVDLTGTVGYGASFLDESFGELGKIFGLLECQRRLTFNCEDDPTLIPMVWNKIKKGDESRKG